MACYSLCRDIYRCAYRTVVELDGDLSVVVGRYVRIPIECAAVVFHLGQTGFAVIGIVILYGAVEPLEVVFPSEDDARQAVGGCNDVDVCIDANCYVGIRG